MTDQKFRLHIVLILRRESGPEGFMRYLRTRTVGSGDYTQVRHLWQDGMTIEDLLRGIETTSAPEALTTK